MNLARILEQERDVEDLMVLDVGEVRVDQADGTAMTHLALITDDQALRSLIAALGRRS